MFFFCPFSSLILYQPKYPEWPWNSSLDTADIVDDRGIRSYSGSSVCAWLQYQKMEKEFWFYREGIRLPRHPYLHITMKKIKLTHKEAAEETRQAHHIAASSSPGSHDGLEKFGEVYGGRLITSRISKVSTQQSQYLSSALRDSAGKSGPWTPLKWWKCGECMQNEVEVKI